MSSKYSRFDRVYTANLPAILAYAARRCTEPGDAADVAADVFLVAWRRLDTVPDGEEQLWLFWVARRVLANHRRGQRRRSDLADRLRAELEACPPVVHDPASIDVHKALSRLPDRDRELLTLAVWDGLTPAEIATLDDTVAATVRSRLMRARTKLRDELLRAGHVLNDSHSTSGADR